eukprot:4815411-Pyramimonas_sp.AAC.1
MPPALGAQGVDAINRGCPTGTHAIQSFFWQRSNNLKPGLQQLKHSGESWVLFPNLERQQGRETSPCRATS